MSIHVHSWPCSQVAAGQNELTCNAGTSSVRCQELLDLRTQVSRCPCVSNCISQSTRLLTSSHSLEISYCVKHCQNLPSWFPFIPFLLHLSYVEVWENQPHLALGDVLLTGRLVTNQMVSLGQGILEALAGYVGKPDNSLSV